MIYRYLKFSYCCFLLSFSISLAADAEQIDNNIGHTIIKRSLDSDKINELLVASMLAEELAPSLTPKLLEKALIVSELKVLPYQLAVYYCLNALASELCQKDEYTIKLADNDHNNIEPYLYLFVNNFENEQWHSAFQSLQKGLRTNETNSYYLQKLQLARKVLKYQGFPSNILNSTAENIALSKYPHYYSKLMSFCPKAAKKSYEWKDLCLTLGLRLENYGDTILATMVGFGIQRDILKHSKIDSEIRLYKDVMKRRDAYMAIRNQFKKRFKPLLDADNRPESFYDLLIKNGQFAVLQHYLKKE